MTFRTFRFSRVLAVALTLASGCATLPLQEPEVEPQSFSLSTASFSEVQVVIEADVFNPNPIGLPLDAIDYDISVGGTHLASGTATLSNEIPANASTTARIPVRISLANALLRARTLTTGTYEYTAVLHFGTELGEISVEISDGGTF